MKLYINNTLTLILFALLLVPSANEGSKLLADYQTLDKIDTLFFYVWAAVFVVSAIVLIFKLKLVITTNKKIIVIFPLQFRYKSLKKLSVNRISWDTMRILVLDFRVMILRGRSGKKIKVSDFDIYNFSSLEKELMKAVSADRDSRNQKEDTAYEQAQFNKPVVDFLLILLAVALVILVLAMLKYQNIKVLVLMLSDFVIMFQIKFLRDYYNKVMKTYTHDRFIETHK